jgi:hypothetical protein
MSGESLCARIDRAWSSITVTRAGGGASPSSYVTTWSWNRFGGFSVGRGFTAAFY